MSLRTVKSRMRYLAESVEGILEDTDRGRLLGILMYWKVFDGIDIPDHVMREILSKGNNPESLGRIVRFVIEDIKKEQIEARKDENED